MTGHRTDGPTWTSRITGPRAFVVGAVLGAGVLWAGGWTLGLRSSGGKALPGLAHAVEPGPRSDQSGRVMIDPGEYSRQVAVTTLLSQPHEIYEAKLVFHRDKTRPGSAVQQFADVFGEAILTGRKPRAGYGLTINPASGVVDPEPQAP